MWARTLIVETSGNICFVLWCFFNYLFFFYFFDIFFLCLFIYLFFSVCCWCCFRVFLSFDFCCFVFLFSCHFFLCLSFVFFAFFSLFFCFCFVFLFLFVLLLGFLFVCLVYCFLLFVFSVFYYSFVLFVFVFVQFCFYHLSWLLSFFFNWLCCVSCRVLVSWPWVTTEPQLWEHWDQATGPPDNSCPLGILIGMSSPRMPHLNSKTRLQPTACKLHCWAPQAKQQARQGQSPTHQQISCL